MGGREAPSSAPVELLTAIGGGGRETFSSSRAEGVPVHIAVFGTVGSGYVVLIARCTKRPYFFKYVPLPLC